MRLLIAIALVALVTAEYEFEFIGHPDQIDYINSVQD